MDQKARPAPRGGVSSTSAARSGALLSSRPNGAVWGLYPESQGSQRHLYEWDGQCENYENQPVIFSVHEGSSSA